MEDRGWFAMGLDRDKVPIDAMASNIGHCLWTGIVDEDKAAVVAECLLSPSMFSGWGIRTLSSDMTGYNPIGHVFYYSATSTFGEWLRDPAGNTGRASTSVLIGGGIIARNRQHASTRPAFERALADAGLVPAEQLARVFVQADERGRVGRNARTGDNE